MVARSHAGSAPPRFAARADGTDETSGLQAFLVHLERKGLVPRARSRAEDRSQASARADMESAVRKLIEALRELS